MLEILADRENTPRAVSEFHFTDSFRFWLAPSPALSLVLYMLARDRLTLESWWCADGTKNL